MATGPSQSWQLSSLSQPQRTDYLAQTLRQSRPINIPGGTDLAELQEPVLSNWHLTVPGTSPESRVISSEAAIVLYSHNEFTIDARDIAPFASWSIQGIYRPCDLVTRLTVLCPRREPLSVPTATRNSELQPLLSFPRLQRVCIAFQDGPFKIGGPRYYLWPVAWVVSELAKRMQVQLQLEQYDIPGAVGSEALSDITAFTHPVTADDKAAVEQRQRTVDAYTGNLSYIKGILLDCGWTLKAVDDVEERLGRVLFHLWAEEQRLDVLESQDVVMY